MVGNFPVTIDMLMIAVMYVIVTDSKSYMYRRVIPSEPAELVFFRFLVFNMTVYIYEKMTIINVLLWDNTVLICNI